MRFGGRPPWRPKMVDLTGNLSGAIQRIFLWVLLEERPTNGWPTLLIMDANAVFPTPIDVVRAQVPYPSDCGRTFWSASVNAVLKPVTDRMRKSGKTQQVVIPSIAHRLITIAIQS